MPRNFIELFRTRKTNDSVSLALCYAGKESCLPGHFFGPASRAHYLIHFILNGKGQFVAHSNVYKLGSNQLFILKPGETATVEEIREFVATHMAKHKTPRYVAFVDSSPMNAAGKILKYKMREQAVEMLNLQADNAIETA